MVDQKGANKVTRGLVRSFLTRLRPKVKIAICFTVRKLKKSSNKLMNRNVKDEKVKERKLRGFNEQIKALKTVHSVDVAKYVLLSDKSRDAVLSDISASTHQKALARVATHKALQEEIKKFRNEHPNWAEEVPNIIKNLGINFGKKRLTKPKKNGKINKVLNGDRKPLTVLNEVADLGVDKQMRTDAEVTRKKAKRAKVKLTLGEGKKKKIKQEEDDDDDLDDDDDDDDDATTVKSPVKISSLLENIDSDSDEDDDDEEEEKKEIEKRENKSKFIKQNEKSNKIASKKSKEKSSESKPILKKNLKRKDADDDSDYDDSKILRSKMFRGDDSSSGKKGVRSGGRGGSSDRGGSERGFRGGRSRGSSRGRGSGRGSQYGSQERTSFSKDREEGSFSERNRGNRGGFGDRGRGRGNRLGSGDRGVFGDRGRGRGSRGGFGDRGRGRGNRGGFGDRGRGSRGGFGDRGRGKKK